MICGDVWIVTSTRREKNNTNVVEMILNCMIAEARHYHY